MSLLRSALALVFALLLSPDAQALFRAYVASDGSDANPCTLVSPCRLLPAALAAVADGGEIWMLDSANYNTATVNVAKSVTILAVPGAVGSVVATGGPAVSVAASGLRIVLRNLVIVPLPGAGATHGISVSASTVIVENSTISNMPNDGIHATGTLAAVHVAGSTIIGSGGSAVSAEDGATADVQGTRLLENAIGVHAVSNSATTASATVADCLISGSGGVGVFAVALSSSSVARIAVTRTMINKLSLGIAASATPPAQATLTVSYSTVTQTYYGWQQNGTGSTIYTLGNNHISEYIDFSGSLTLSTLK